MTTLLSLILGALAITVANLAIIAIRSGEVKWRNGSVAATRSETPGAFWGIILLQCIVFATIVGTIFF